MNILHSFTSTKVFSSHFHGVLSRLVQSIVLGPWWCKSGQRPFLLLQRSEFKSCWQLNFSALYLEKTKINEKESRVGLFFFNKSYRFLSARYAITDTWLLSLAQSKAVLDKRSLASTSALFSTRNVTASS